MLTTASLYPHLHCPKYDIRNQIYVTKHHAPEEGELGELVPQLCKRREEEPRVAAAMTILASMIMSL